MKNPKLYSTNAKNTKYLFKIFILDKFKKLNLVFFGEKNFNFKGLKIDL